MQNWPYCEPPNPFKLAEFKREAGGGITLDPQNYINDQNGSDNTPYALGSYKTVIQTSRPFDYASIITICTGISQYILPAEIDGRNIQILGRLRFGVGGGLFEVNFDWKNGTQFTVATDTVTLDAAFLTIPGTTGPIVASIQGAMIFGTGPARQQLTRSFPRTELLRFDPETPADISFRVPPFAHALYIFSVESEFYIPGNVEVAFCSGPNCDFSAATGDETLLIIDGSEFLGAMNSEDGLRFPEGTRFVVIRNLGSTDFNITPTFTLSM